MNVATLEALSGVLTRDMNWRIREISDLKHSIRVGPAQLRQSTMRAAIPIFYAHWEGHVRVCATGYVSHIALKRLEFKQILRSYMIANLRGEFDRLSGQPLSKMQQIALIEKIFATEIDHFRSRSDYLVDTRSNLSYGTLCEILTVLGLEASSFEADELFIDKILLHKRNNIAHGQSITLADDELEDIAGRTIGIMRTFRNLVENAALVGAYKRAPSA
jgi:hypothetical protein